MGNQKQLSPTDPELDRWAARNLCFRSADRSRPTLLLAAQEPQNDRSNSAKSRKELRRNLSRADVFCRILVIGIIYLCLAIAAAGRHYISRRWVEFANKNKDLRLEPEEMGADKANSIGDRQRAIHDDRQRELFPAKSAAWRKTFSGRPRRPSSTSRNETRITLISPTGLIGDRPGDRAARARPPAQADRKDRRALARNRGRHVWLLRRDRRANLDQAP